MSFCALATPPLRHHQDPAAARCILIVDDSRMNRKLACELLAFSGYAIQEAGSAEEALEAIALDPPALILMDIGLPGMDGLALTRLLKSRPETQGIVIVALTAFAMNGDRERVLEAGCDGYLAKPIDTRRMAAQVAEYLA